MHVAQRQLVHRRVAVGQAQAVNEAHARIRGAHHARAQRHVHAGHEAVVAVAQVQRAVGEGRGAVANITHTRPFAEHLHHAEVVRGAQVQALDLLALRGGAGQRALAVAQRHVGRAAGPADATAHVAPAFRRAVGQVADLGVLVQRVLHLAVEAAQVRRQEVADRIAGAHVVVGRAHDGAGPGGGGQAAVDVGHQVGAHALRAEGAEHGVVPEGRGVVAAQAHFAEGARQAQGRAAVEVVDALGTVVVGDARLEPEAGRQAAAQVFRAAKADAAARIARVRQRGLARLRTAARGVRRWLREGVGAVVRALGRVAADADVDDAEHGHGRLRRRGTGGGEESQCGQGVMFHGRSCFACFFRDERVRWCASLRSRARVFRRADALRGLREKRGAASSRARRACGRASRHSHRVARAAHAAQGSRRSRIASHGRRKKPDQRTRRGAAKQRQACRQGTCMSHLGSSSLFFDWPVL
ncbi:hypothetical protein D9M68_438930 [compost metagenome]